MKTTVDVYSFREAFRTCRPDNFTYEGLTALFDHLEEYEDSVENEIELDVLTICCDFTEYKDLKELMNEYDSITSMDDLLDCTQVIEFDGGIIIQCF